VMVASATARRESRGAHFRADYPARDDARFLHHTLAFRAGPADDRFAFGSRPVDVSHQQPSERSY
jgi:succinate dehydrogenase / fumarate reductase flavoprotein subunit